MAQIHPSSLVDPQAKLAENVVVGPFCTIGPHVEVGEGTTLQSHIVLTGHTKIGKNNKIYAFAAIGIDPQDKKYRGEETQLIIGDKKTGKTQIALDAIANQKGKDVICIYVPIGKVKKNAVSYTHLTLPTNSRV